jgi:3-oxoacyl-[acyl-carrier-protein] synthase-3
VKLLATGSYVPPIILKNEELEERVDTSAKWIEENLGIRERRIAGPNQKTADLATYAGWAALENADLSVRDVDLLIVATATRTAKRPPWRVLFRRGLGCVTLFASTLTPYAPGFCMVCPLQRLTFLWAFTTPL